MSKTLHSMNRAFTPGPPPMEAAKEVAELLSHSWVPLEDEAIFAIEEIATEEWQPMVWSLVEDAYGGATFSPEEASQLADECRELVEKADPATAISLKAIADFAAAASKEGKHLCAHAD